MDENNIPDENRPGPGAGESAAGDGEASGIGGGTFRIPDENEIDVPDGKKYAYVDMTVGEYVNANLPFSVHYYTAICLQRPQADVTIDLCPTRASPAR